MLALRSLAMTFKSNSKAVRRLNLSLGHLQNNQFSTNSAKANIIALFKNVHQGIKYTPNYKNYAVDDKGEVVSYFHDIPLDFNPSTFEANMIVEIPRWSNGKFEINTKVEGNPITQDIKKGEVRFVKNLFPYHGYIHNYGAFPQTWENPTEKGEGLDLFGDNDPLDVCEIGSTVSKTGDIKRVKILGSLALIDDNELDWKIIVIDVNDPIALKVTDITDVKKSFPGLLEATRTWFRDYKLPDGKPQNEFAFNGDYKNRDETIEVINSCISSWKKLINGEVSHDKLPSISNTSQEGTPKYRKTFESAKLLIEPYKGESEISSSVHKSYFF